MDRQMESIKIEVPLPEALAEELIHFWQAIFETSYEEFRGLLAGAERAHNRDIVYLIRQGRQLIGTCHLTIPTAAPAVGGFGEVATAPAFRGRGIARALCAQARDDFRSQGGQALFLGTGNPTAARVYHRVGWRKLAGAMVMANITTGDSPEAFLVDYFRECGTAHVIMGTAADRIPVIPLLVSPHDWQVLDANVNRISTRYATLTSCMGLYPRYQALTQDGHGAWFSTRTRRGQSVGLATIRIDGLHQAQVDGFAHHNFRSVWSDLIEAAIRWGADRGASLMRAAVSVEDEEKQALFASLGFRQTGRDDGFSIGGRQVAAIHLERTTADNS